MPLQRYSNGGIIAIPLLWQWSGNGVAMMPLHIAQGRAADSCSIYIIFSTKNLEKSRTEPNNLRGKQRTVKYREEAWTKPNKAE